MGKIAPELAVLNFSRQGFFPPLYLSPIELDGSELRDLHLFCLISYPTVPSIFFKCFFLSLKNCVGANLALPFGTPRFRTEIKIEHGQTRTLFALSACFLEVIQALKSASVHCPN